MQKRNSSPSENCKKIEGLPQQRHCLIFVFLRYLRFGKTLFFSARYIFLGGVRNSQCIFPLTRAFDLDGQTLRGEAWKAVPSQCMEKFARSLARIPLGFFVNNRTQCGSEGLDETHGVACCEMVAISVDDQSSSNCRTGRFIAEFG